MGVTDRWQQIGCSLWKVRMDKQRPDSPSSPHAARATQRCTAHNVFAERGAEQSSSVLTYADTTDSLTGALDKGKARVRRVTGRIESQQ